MAKHPQFSQFANVVRRAKLQAVAYRARKMPTYFFDVIDGARTYCDFDGLHFSDLNAALDHSIQLTVEFVDEGLVSAPARKCAVRARSACGEALEVVSFVPWQRSGVMKVH